MGMILENQNTFLGGLMADAKQIAGALFGVAVLTAFLGLLVAPALEPLLCHDLLHKAAGGGSLDEIGPARKTLKSFRLVLWTLCILAWTIALLILSGHNLCNY